MQAVEASGSEDRQQLDGRIRSIVEEVIAGTSLFIVDVVLRGQKGSLAVDIFLDSDVGLGVDTLADVSREVEFILDTEDLIKGRYSLNISSPGVDRPLVFPRQYRKNVGRALKVRYRDPESGTDKEIVGELLAADEEAIEIAEGKAGSKRLVYDDIVWAKVQLPW